MKISIVTIFLFQILSPASLAGQPEKSLARVKNPHHVIVYHKQGRFAGWPANNGIWSWKKGKEILVGYTVGRYDLEQEGHKIVNPKNALARSRDGGKTWTSFSVEKIADENIVPAELNRKINFKHRNFAFRVRGIGYHGNDIDTPCFYYSYNRGKTWEGPFLFNGLDEMDQVKDLVMTPRTDYQVMGKNDCLVFFSGTTGPWKDKTFVLKTSDGGLNFSFLSWIVPPTDPYRAVMPQTITLKKDTLLSVQRRRDMPPKSTPCWIDAFVSTDGGKNWSFLSRLADTGHGNSNGNPPAITKLKNGDLCVVYGNRSSKLILCRLSKNNGKTWGEEFIIRDDFHSEATGFADFGYPRVTQRKDGKIVAIYYIATKERPEQHIECSIFSVETNMKFFIQKLHKKE